MRIELDMHEMIFVMQSVDDYKKQINHFNQLDPQQTESLNVYWDRMLKFSKSKGCMDYESQRAWNKINVHIITQMWGSTACGWGGMGGAAMSESYTTVIQSIEGDAIFVYYNGKLAYVADIDDKLKPYQSNGYKSLPSIPNAANKLTTFYINRR
jgi:hypothetical protein